MAKYPYTDIKSHTDVLLKKFTPPTINIPKDIVFNTQLLDANYITTVASINKIPPPKIAIGKRIMGKLMKELNITRLQAAALVGNFYAESGFVPSILQGKHSEGYTLSQAKGIGYGFAQWTYYDRQDRLKAYINQKYKIKDGDKRVLTEDDNIGFVVEELTGRNNISGKFKSTLAILRTYKSDYIPSTSIGFEDIAKATIHIMTKYESPRDQSPQSQSVRIGYAKQLLDN